MKKSILSVVFLGLVAFLLMPSAALACDGAPKVVKADSAAASAQCGAKAASTGDQSRLACADCGCCTKASNCGCLEGAACTCGKNKVGKAATKSSPARK